MASSSTPNPSKRKFEDLESSSLSSDAKAQLTVVLKSITGIYDDVPAEQRKEILAQLEKFNRQTKAELYPSIAEATNEERDEKRRKTTEGENNEHGASILCSANWGTVVRLGSVKAPLSKELTTEVLNDIMKQFRDQLIGLGGVDADHEDIIQTYQWTSASATELANHIFVAMLGGTSYRVRSDLYNTDRVSKQSGLGLGYWALKAAQNAPPLSADFFYRIANFRKSQYNYRSFSILATHWHQYKMTLLYDKLEGKLENEQDAELFAYLEEHMETSPKVISDIPIVDVFIEEGPMFAKWNKKNRLQAFTEGTALIGFVEVFGEGALAFLSDGSVKWLQEVECNLHLKHAWKLLDRLCPELRELADLMNEKILQPLQKGQDIIAKSSRYGASVQEILETL